MVSRFGAADYKSIFGPAVLLGFGVIIVTILYSQGWTGGWHFDDQANLNALYDIFGSGYVDWKLALDFILSGDAGPLGRPISLAGFLVDGSTWPETPGAMLYTNSLLHALNGLLLCGLWLAVLRQRKDSLSRNQWVAVVAVTLWLLQPLLVSGVLMAVQRMTLLSSSFMLLGAWVYVLGRERIEAQPLKGWVLVLIGVGAGTFLGAFSKEQAAILPVLLWVMERCILRPPQLSPGGVRLWIAFKCFAFYLPTILILFYLSRIALNHEAAFASRDFGLLDRLWTQSVVLWDYIRLMVFPRAIEYGPFHDDYPVYSAGVKPVLAVVAWIALLVVVWVMRAKSRWPLFALLWFATSHVIESTVVPLELYFEHRNYLAIAGPLLALVALTAQWSSRSLARQKVAAVMFALYGLSISFVLWQVSSIFGQSDVAARLWYEQHPSSIRAGQYLAGKLSESGDVRGALKVLDENSEGQLFSGATRLQGLQLACVLSVPREELESRLELVLEELSKSDRRFSINDPLDRIKILMDKRYCNGFFTAETLMSIAEAAISSPGFQKSPLELSNLHFFISTLYIDYGNLNLSMLHMEAAMEAAPQLITLKNMVALLGSAGLYHEARDLFDIYPVRWPRNPVLRMKQKMEWRELKGRVEENINRDGNAL